MDCTAKVCGAVRGQYIESCRGAVQLEVLPGYVREFSPCEYRLGYFKPQELGNFCPHDMYELSDFARRRLRSMHRRSTLVAAFWQQAEVPF